MPVSWGKGALRPSVESLGQVNPSAKFGDPHPMASQSSQSPVGTSHSRRDPDYAGSRPHCGPQGSLGQLSRVGCTLTALSLATPPTPVHSLDSSTSLCYYLLVGLQSWKEGSECVWPNFHQLSSQEDYQWGGPS